MSLCLRGSSKPEDIDDFIDDWHSDLYDDIPIHEFLGMTEEEYGVWMLHPDTLQSIIDSHREKG